MTTSDVRQRKRAAIDDIARAAKRLADRVGSRGVMSIHIDRVVIDDGADAQGLKDLEHRLLAAISESKESIMAVLDALRAAQGETKTLLLAAAGVIEEINTDLADLLARLANAAPGSQEVLDATVEATEIKTGLTSAVEALRAAAAQHTPGAVTPPTPPPVEPPPPPPPSEVVEP